MTQERGGSSNIPLNDLKGFAAAQKSVDVFVGDTAHVDMGLLGEYVKRKLIRRRKHPDASFQIYNYADETRAQALWTPVTRLTRGLIVDPEQGGLIVARPFTRMSDLSEREETPKDPITVYDKLDGSLGIQYWLGDQPRIATRGSFVDSVGRIDGANEKLSHYEEYPFDRDVTYLWEIIDPRFQHTVDYGDRDEIVLIGMVETATGNNIQLPEEGTVPFPVVQSFPELETYEQVRRRVNDRPNTEGFVIVKASGARTRIKSEEYYAKDDLRKGLMPFKIWEHMRQGGRLQTLLRRFPSVMHEEITTIYTEIQTKVEQIEALLEDVKYVNPMDAATEAKQRAARRRAVYNLVQPSMSQAQEKVAPIEEIPTEI